MSPSPSRRRALHHVTALATLATLLASTGLAEAGGAVLPSPTATSANLEVEVAVAASPQATTRWTRFTLQGGGPEVLWLVPVRPGAALDQKGDAFLDALRESSRPRILPPDGPQPNGCFALSRTESPTWESPAGATAASKDLTLLSTEADARAYAAAHGFVVNAATADRLRAVFDAGSKLVAFRLAAAAAAVSTPTLRVSDDGAPVLPFALTGDLPSMVKLTAYAIGPGVAWVPNAGGLTSSLAWHPDGTSTYAWERMNAVGGGNAFLREAAGRELLFGAPSSSPVAISSVVDQVLSPSCATKARAAAATTGTVDRVCAAGELGRVPGGTACTPSAGGVPATDFACDGFDDLAIALSGQAPATVAATRFVGVVPANRLGTDAPLTFAANSAATAPVRRADAWACDAPPPAKPDYPATPEWPAYDPSQYPGGSLTSNGSSGGDRTYYVYEESCSGSSRLAYADDDPPVVRDDSCGSSSTVVSSSDDVSSSSDDDLSGWSSSDSSSDSCDSSSSDGWDSGDSGGCGGDSSSSSESCDAGSSDGWDSDSSSDGWDDADMTPAAKKLRKAPSTGGKLSIGPKQHGKKRGPSPLSRIAVVAAAIVLPLRRRLRGKKTSGGDDFRA